MKKKVIILMFVVASFIISCGSDTPTPAPELPVIRVGWIAWPGFYPLVLIKELGLDVKHGVHVEPVFSQDIVTMRNNWEINKVEAIFVNMSGLIQETNKDSKLAKAIFITDRTNNGDVIVAIPEIKTVADLKGKRIGIAMTGSSGNIMVRRMLEAHGLTIQDVELVNVDGNDIPNAMPKLIDAGYTWEPHLTKAKEKGFKVIYSSAEDLTLPINIMLMMQTKVIQAHPEAVKGFVAAWFEAVAIWQADPAKYSPLVAKIVGGTAEEIAKNKVNFLSLEQNIERFENGSLVKETQIQADFLISTGELNHAPEINDLLDGSFLKP